MRVVAGSARSRPLRSPDGGATRPTSDRVREAVFNSLFSRGPIAGARAADLFAGSGALGIEALSRGADMVWFIESDRRAADVIDDNLATLRFVDRAVVVRGLVESSLDALPTDLDLVLVDPPYGFDDWAPLMASLAGHVVDDAVVVVESDRTVTLGAGWEKVRERTYGGTVITFAVPTGGPSDPIDATGGDA